MLSPLCYHAKSNYYNHILLLWFQRITNRAPTWGSPSPTAILFSKHSHSAHSHSVPTWGSPSPTPILFTKHSHSALDVFTALPVFYSLSNVTAQLRVFTALSLFTAGVLPAALDFWLKRAACCCCHGPNCCWWWMCCSWFSMCSALAASLCSTVCFCTRLSLVAVAGSFACWTIAGSDGGAFGLIRSHVVSGFYLCAFAFHMFHLFPYVVVDSLMPLSRNGHSSRMKIFTFAKLSRTPCLSFAGPMLAQQHALMKIRSPPAKLRQRIMDHFLVAF